MARFMCIDKMAMITATFVYGHNGAQACAPVMYNVHDTILCIHVHVHVPHSNSSNLHHPQCILIKYIVSLLHYYK